MTHHENKNLSVSKRSRLLKRIKTAPPAPRSATRNAANSFKKERAAAVIVPRKKRAFPGALSKDELRDAITSAKKLGLSQPISKSALQRRSTSCFGAKGTPRALTREHQTPRARNARQAWTRPASHYGGTRVEQRQNTSRGARLPETCTLSLDARTRQVLAARVTKGTRQRSPRSKTHYSKKRRGTLREVAGDFGLPVRVRTRQTR